MKTIKLMNIAILCMALTLGACSNGEDGTDGLPGKNGNEGAAGANGVSCWDLNGNGIGDGKEDANQDGNYDALDCKGEEGEQGADGNANVQAFAFNLDDFSDYGNLSLPLTDFLPQEELGNYAYLFYIEKSAGGLVVRYTIPGPLSANQHYVRVLTDLAEGTLSIDFYNTSNDSVYTVAGGEYSQVIVIAVEISDTSKGATSLLGELKSAGVDTNDYDAVANYFGL